MKITINFIEGTKINGQLTQQAVKDKNFTVEEVNQFLKNLNEGYGLRFNYPDQDSIIIPATSVKSVEVTL